MLACGMCAIQSPMSIAAAGILGGWATYTVLRPYRFGKRMPRLWGLPRFGLSDFLSLFLLMLGPLFVARIGRDEYEPSRVLTCFGLLAVCVLYLWARGLWILEQLGINQFHRRTLFLAICLPIAVLFGFLVGDWVFSALLMLPMGRIDLILVGSIGYAIGGGILYAVLHVGLNHVFGKPAVRRRVPLEANAE
jgi:hypothetical protein